jgi:HAD superfamily hydrolase (TIGR01509 family)
VSNLSGVPLLMCDLDDTLVERPPLLRAWAEEFLAERGRPELVDWVVEQDAGGHRPREEFLSAVARRTGYDAPVAQLLVDYNDRLGGSYRLVPDVRSVLEEARSTGWRIAVVTNGPTTVQTHKLRSSGIDGLVDAVCISEEVGVRKPDPVIFRTAAARAGATLDGAWMVGDNLDADIAGARAVGARTVWVRRDYDRLSYTSGVAPDLVAGSFPDAVRLVLDGTG